MNLLVINFTMDEMHGVLAWQARVVDELALHCERVVVITSVLGRYSPPPNVTVYPVPKRPLGVRHRLGGRWFLNWHVFHLCREHEIDAVFIHMDMEWSYRLFPVFSLLKLPVAVWYAHGTVTNRLRWAIRCADRVVTSTPEGCRVKSGKIRVIGQGVDTELFQIPDIRIPRDILYIGRISPRKRIGLLVEVADEIRKKQGMEGCRIKVIGPVLTQEDIEYDRTIRAQIWDQGLEDVMDMEGYVPMKHLPAFYQNAFLHLNVSETNSMDKTVVEALSAGCPVLTSNPSFFEMLRGYPEFLIRDERPAAIAEQVKHIRKQWEGYDPQKLRALVSGSHDLRSYALRILREIEGCIKQ